MHNTFNETIQARAKELKVDPKLLLFAIGGIADGKSDIEVISRFIASVREDMKAQAISQVQSKNKRSVEAGNYALTDVDQDTLCASAAGAFGFMAADNYLDLSKPVMWYELIAWQHAQKQVLRLHKLKPKQTISQTGQSVREGFLSIISLYCEDEIEAARQLGHIFEQDIAFN